jgi:hypothetical protein
MTGLDVLLALAGFFVTVLVIAGMILITPRGQVPVHTEGTDAQGSNLSPKPASGGTSATTGTEAARVGGA